MKPVERVAVTGIGVVSPLGCELETVWSNLTQGVSGITTLPALEGLPVTFGGQARGFCPENYIEPKELRHLDRYAQMAVTAGLDAWTMAGVASGTYAPERVGVMACSGAGGLESLENSIKNFNEKGPRRVSPMTVPMFIPNIASGVLAMRLNVNGPGFCVSSACASGNHAIAMAVNLIQCGQADCMLTGAVEACLTPFAISAFASMRALSTRCDAPERASRPFDKDRDGFVMSEGGAMLVLERESLARARGAKILGYVAGYGMTQDAHHMVAPDPEGKGVILAIRQALASADVAPEAIGYVNAHGTSTALNDKAETMAIRQVFGAHADKLKLSSTKSMTGHMIAGTAALEAAICLLAMRDGLIPPTINLDEPGEGCDLDYTPKQAAKAEVEYCLSNAFGFGGQNAVVILERGEQ